MEGTPQGRNEPLHLDLHHLTERENVGYPATSRDVNPSGRPRIKNQCTVIFCFLAPELLFLLNVANFPPYF
jgi:hypothetical protein